MHSQTANPEPALHLNARQRPRWRRTHPPDYVCRQRRFHGAPGVCVVASFHPPAGFIAACSIVLEGGYVQPWYLVTRIVLSEVQSSTPVRGW